MPDTIPVCSKCGIIKKSGKSSCCSRGGSWFGKCGSAGDSNHEHTWSEGILACKEWARSNVASVEESKAAQELGLSGGAGNLSSLPSANAAVNVSTAKTDKISFSTTAYTSTTTALATLATNEATVVTDWVSQGMHAMHARHTSMYFFGRWTTSFPPATHVQIRSRWE